MYALSAKPSTVKVHNMTLESEKYHDMPSFHPGMINWSSWSNRYAYSYVSKV